MTRFLSILDKITMTKSLLMTFFLYNTIVSYIAHTSLSIFSDAYVLNPLSNVPNFSLKIKQFSHHRQKNWTPNKLLLISERQDEDNSVQSSFLSHPRRTLQRNQDYCFDLIAIAGSKPTLIKSKRIRTQSAERFKVFRQFGHSPRNNGDSSDNRKHDPSRISIRFRRVIMVVLGLLWYGQSQTEAANAAVALSASVAVAASTAGSTSSAASNYLAIPTANNSITILALFVVLNTLMSNAVSFGAALRWFASWYMTNLNTFPMITKAVTAGVIGIAGDYMAQWLEYFLLERKKEKSQSHTRQSSSTSNARRSFADVFSIFGHYHLRRGLSILADGILISGPLMHIGYECFEKIIPVSSGGGAGSALAAFSHVLADSIILDSIFIASTFIMTGLFEGYKPRQIIPQFKSDYIPSLKASWATSLALMPIEFICFRFLPLSFRVLAVNFIDVVWDAVISFMAHRNRNKDDVIIQSSKSTSGKSLDNPVQKPFESDDKSHQKSTSSTSINTSYHPNQQQHIRYLDSIMLRQQKFDSIATLSLNASPDAVVLFQAAAPALAPVKTPQVL